MTKIEALKLALDGEKVRHSDWFKDNYLIYKDNQFTYVSTGGKNCSDSHTLHNIFNSGSYDSDNWNVFKPEPKFKVGDMVRTKDTDVFGKVAQVDRYKSCYWVEFGKFSTRSLYLMEHEIEPV